MSINVRWVRTLRAIIVMSLLVVALLGAVLGSVGRSGQFSSWAPDPGARQTAPAGSSG